MVSKFSANMHDICRIILEEVTKFPKGAYWMRMSGYSEYYDSHGFSRFSYGSQIIRGFRELGTLRYVSRHSAKEIFKRILGSRCHNPRILKVCDLEKVEQWSKRSPATSLDEWLVFVGQNRKTKPKKKRR